MSRVRTVKSVEERREEIISAARELFITNGYKSTSVANIASELGVAQGLIFHYFKTKAALLYTVFDQIAAEEQAMTSEFLKSYDGKMVDCLAQVFQRGQPLGVHEELFADLADDPAILEYLRDKLVGLSVPMIKEVLERGNSDGSWSCDYPEQTAIFITQGFSGILKNYGEYDADLMQKAVHNIMLKLLNIDSLPSTVQSTIWHGKGE